MAKSAGDKITELDYNTLQSNIAVIMGTPAGTTDTTATGYNQSLSSSQVSVGNKVTAAQWDNLRSDITKAYTHQFGSAPTITDVGTSTTIDAATYNQYEALMTTVSGDPNRYTLGFGQSSISTGQTAELSAGWNGTQTHQFTVTFASANERRAFFNAGGQIRYNISLAYTGSESKTLDWQNMMDAVSTMRFNYKETTRNGVTVTSNIGNYDLTSTFQTIISSDGTNPYAENRIFVSARANSATQLEFRVGLTDDDAGDRPVPSPPPPYGPLVDENVQGTTTGNVFILRPSGSNVSVPAPTVAAAAGNTFTVI